MSQRKQSSLFAVIEMRWSTVNFFNHKEIEECYFLDFIAEPHSPTRLLFHQCHSSFSNPSVASGTSPGKPLMGKHSIDCILHIGSDCRQ